MSIDSFDCYARDYVTLVYKINNNSRVRVIRVVPLLVKKQYDGRERRRGG
jgi:hypothetical protein